MKMIPTFLAAAGLAALGSLSEAQSFDVDDVVKAHVIPGWRGSDGRHVAALHLELGEGWKTYWRAPGDAGIPPRFNWAGSRNVSTVKVDWPMPKQIPQGRYMTIGYDSSVTLPLYIAPKAAGRAMRLTGEIELGVCREVCIPVTVSVAQDLPNTKGKRDPAIVASLASRPYSASEAGVSDVACRISPTEDGLQLSAVITMPKQGAREVTVFEVGDPKIWVAPSKSERQGGKIVAQTTMQHVSGRSFALKRSDVRITVLGQGRAVEIQGCPAD
ncbi:MAG: protein-disulfide reductase DsbD domain-containing protein [Pseudomonadota bacterium]